MASSSGFSKVFTYSAPSRNFEIWRCSIRSKLTTLEIGVTGMISSASCVIDSRDELILDAEIFHERSFRRQALANIFQRGNRGGGACAYARLRRGKIAQCAKQLILVCQRFLLQLLDSLRRRILGTQLFKFDAAVIPIQLLAHLAHPADQAALARVRHWQHVTVLHEQFSEAARFRQFHVAECFLARVAAFVCH